MYDLYVITKYLGYKTDSMTTTVMPFNDQHTADLVAEKLTTANTNEVGGKSLYITVIKLY